MRSSALTVPSPLVSAGSDFVDEVLDEDVEDSPASVELASGGGPGGGPPACAGQQFSRTTRPHHIDGQIQSL
jgi:hypothetical protein